MFIIPGFYQNVNTILIIYEQNNTNCYRKTIINAGNQPRQKKILDDGPETYETPLPVEKISRLMQQEGYAVEPSPDAGAFVCNDTFYLAGMMSQAPVSFIHVPARPEQAEDFARTVKRVIELAVEADPAHTT